MTNVKQPIHAVFSLMLAMILALGTFFSAPGIGRVLAKWSGNGNTTDLNAAVTIKTQEAADNIKDGIKGIDVSEYQGSINWSKVKDSGIKFAFIRASVGSTSDKNFRQNARNAHEAGILVGAYHYATFTSKATAIEQAEFFLSHLDGIDITYPLVLDLENNRGNLSKEKLTTAALAFMETVKKAGYTVMLYSYDNYFHAYLEMDRFDGYHVWAANYVEQPVKVDHKIWQHTSYGSVNGIVGRVDINIAYEDMRLRKKVVVDKEKSDQIKKYLNNTYNAKLDIDQLVMADIKASMVKGLQTELNALDPEARLVVDGELYSGTADYLDSIAWSEKRNTPNVISLVQASLFYKGYYAQELNGTMDAATVQALKDFQKDKSISQTGAIDTWELELLFK